MSGARFRSRWVRCLACSTLVICTGGPARAEDAAGASPAPAASGTGDEAPAGPTIAVAADLAADTTSNAHVRAALYEVARKIGYTPAGKLDIAGIAAQNSLMKAGSITSDPSQLPALRTALGVNVLVRLSKDADLGGSVVARLQVLTSRGLRTEVVRTPPGATEALESALERLLPPIYAPKTEEKTKPLPAGVVGLMPDQKKPDNTQKPREAWEARGGLRPMYGATVLLSATQIQHVPVNGRDPNTGAPVTGSANATGAGGGVGVRAGLIYLPVPDPKLSTGGFVSFRMGVGLDNDVFWMQKPVGYDFSASGNRSVKYDDQALWVASLPMTLGFAVAAGRFASDYSWHGALIGFAYAPALQFSMDLKNTSGKFRSNLAGAEASVDITRLDAGESSDAQMQIRVSVWGLMPLDDDHPGILTLGLGAIWY